jgi:GT2 family glycosyltransferase
MEKIKYSIVIPTYNHCDDLLKPCIESILKNSFIRDIELIVSANGCIDNTKQYLDELKETFDELGLSKHFKIVWNEKPLGYAKATNEGIKQATADKIVLYSNDVIVLDYWEKGKWLKVLEEPFKNDKSVGVTGSLLKYSPVTKSKFAIFFCVMIDKKVFDKIGLVSEDYGVGGHEDTDFCYVAEQAGYKIVGVDENKRWSKELNMHVGQFPIYHKGEGTVHDKTLVPDWDVIFTNNELLLAKKFNLEWYEQHKHLEKKFPATQSKPITEKNDKEILCSISTKGRYDTTLPMAIAAVINQTLKPNKIIIFDDNDEPIDVRETQHYLYLLQMMEATGIKWEWQFALKKGQHYNHQRANTMGYKWVWRVDDDCIPEYNVLETLYKKANSDPKIGAVGGSILTTPIWGKINSTGKIEDVDNEQNLQWYYIEKELEVDHVHCSFLYRAGVADYCLELSKVAHREETLFTYELVQKGYKNILVPNANTWHLKNKKGGIRTGSVELFAHDDAIFKRKIQIKDKTIVVLNCGMGDHIIFKKILPELKNPVIYSCYPDIVPGKSIADAYMELGNIDEYNVYAKMDQWNWKDSLENAFRKLYNLS